MISKRIFIITASTIVVGGLGLFLISKNSKVPNASPEVATISPTSARPPAILATWTDEAGFSFQYPEGTNIDKHPDDTKNYANLTLTYPSGDIVTVMMSDNTFKNLDSWVGQNAALDTTLGSQPAKKILENGQETIACIDNGVLVKVTGKDISGIVNSWAFIYPTTTTSKNANAAPASDENVLVEE